MGIIMSGHIQVMYPLNQFLSLYLSQNPKEVRHCYNGERDFSASLPFSSFNFLKNVRSLLNVRTRTLIHESFPRFHIYSV